MKHSILSYILAAIMLTACMTACTTTSSPDDTPTVSTDNTTTQIPEENIPDITPSEETTENITPETDTEKTEEPEEQKEPVYVDYTIEYYDVVEDKMLEYSGTQEFEGEIRPMFFIEKLSELTGTSIAVNSVKINGSAITVDYSTQGAPFHGTGSFEESAILNSVSAVLMNVFDQAESIYITADGKDYESGHIYHPKDTPYATRKTQQLG